VNANTAFALVIKEVQGVISLVLVVNECFQFFAGISDNVRCWYCGIEAKDWACDQGAWEIHALLYPSCQYLLRNRGMGFVEEVLSRVSQEQESFSELSSPTASPHSYPSSPYHSFSGYTESGPEQLPEPLILDPREEHQQKK